MNISEFQERRSKIQLLEESLNFLVNESSIQKPHQTIKSLFYNNKPKNRKNLKKINIKESTLKIINGNNSHAGKIPSIESIIKNSKNNEFLSLDYPNKKYLTKIIIPVQNSNHNISSTMNRLINKSHTVNISNNFEKISQHSRNKNNMDNLIADIQVLKSRKASKMSNGSNLRKTYDLNDLYKQFVENVRKYYYIMLFFDLEYNTKKYFIKKFIRIKEKFKS